MEKTKNLKEEGTTIIKNTSNAEKIMDENKPRNQKENSKANDYKQKECKVINYNAKNKTLDVMFESFGIRIKDVTDNCGSSVVIKYKGEIGKPNFNYRL